MRAIYARAARDASKCIVPGKIYKRVAWLSEIFTNPATL